MSCQVVGTTEKGEDPSSNFISKITNVFTRLFSKPPSEEIFRIEIKAIVSIPYQNSCWRTLSRFAWRAADADADDDDNAAADVDGSLKGGRVAFSLESGVWRLEARGGSKRHTRNRAALGTRDSKLHRGRFGVGFPFSVAELNFWAFQARGRSMNQICFTFSFLSFYFFILLRF